MCGGVAAVVVVVGAYVKAREDVFLLYPLSFVESFIFLLFSLHSLSWYIAKDNK
jgi:hypothetical protein